MRSGQTYLESLDDGRRIVFGREDAINVATHPAFSATAKTIASLYDMKSAEANAETFRTDEDSGNVFFEKPRDKQALARRTRAHDSWAAASFGLLGRSPDCLAACTTGLALDAAAYNRKGRDFASNILGYHRLLADKDLFGVCVLSPALGRRAHRAGDSAGTLRVVRDNDRGIVLKGAKSMATGAIFADEIFVSTNFPIGEEDRAEAITCAVPAAAVGLTMVPRRPSMPLGADAAKWPLSSRFDEEDATLIFDEVEVPWERVFAIGEPAVNSDFLGQSPALSFKVHHANVRFRAKLRAILGLAYRIAQANGSSDVPAVRETLGRLASYESNLDAMIHGQIESCETTAEGYVYYNRRMVFGAQAWCQDIYGKVMETVRQLSGAGFFQMPSSFDVFSDERLGPMMDAHWSNGTRSPEELMRLHVLAWDMLGSEFAMRQGQYEHFYAAPPHKLAQNNFKSCPWEQFAAHIDGMLHADSCKH